jgi:hypothetical protein
MTTHNATDGRPPGTPSPALPLLLGCGEPLRGRSTLAKAARPSSARGQPALSIELHARLIERRLTQQRR